jgi:uncharacterized membrane protein YqhA
VKRALGTARYLVVVGVVFGLVDSLSAFAWGAWKSVVVVRHLLTGELDGMAVALVRVLDGFLLATGLLIFALGLPDIFSDSPDRGEHSLDIMKGRLAAIVVLAIAVEFFGRIEDGGDAHQIMLLGFGGAAISAVLVAFIRFGH